MAAAACGDKPAARSVRACYQHRAASWEILPAANKRRRGTGKRPVQSSGIRRPDWARATRKPKLLFRLSGEFLLRFADRQFWPLLFQLPPRFTRFAKPVAAHRQLFYRAAAEMPTRHAGGSGERHQRCHALLQLPRANLALGEGFFQHPDLARKTPLHPPYYALALRHDGLRLRSATSPPIGLRYRFRSPLLARLD